jgi:CDP-diacylglycerol--serine O-phosphatidyltransferase
MEFALFRSIRMWNLLTYVSGFTSLLAVIFAAEGSPSAAGLCIGLSSLMDVFDGKFANLFHRTALEKKMGVEIDSLADGVAFGFAPVVCLLFLGGVQLWSLVAGGLYIVAALTRLSFYNVMSQEEDARDFVGVPTTVIGVFWTLVLLFPGLSSLAGVFFIVFGLLMVAPLRIRRPGARGLLIVVLPLAVLILIHILRLGAGV